MAITTAILLHGFATPIAISTHFPFLSISAIRKPSPSTTELSSSWLPTYPSPSSSVAAKPSSSVSSQSPVSRFPSTASSGKSSLFTDPSSFSSSRPRTSRLPSISSSAKLLPSTKPSSSSSSSSSRPPTSKFYPISASRIPSPSTDPSSSSSPRTSCFRFISASAKSSPSTKPSSSCSSQPSPISEILAFIQPEWRAIVTGWTFGAVAVFCLSTLVPCLSRLPSSLSVADTDRAIRDGLRLASLICIRSTACYLQEAFLWDAALGSVYRIRRYVFDQLLEHDLGFFEGNDGVAAGDVANRITAEALDVADGVHALLNSTVPNTMQLLAMVSQMVVISPMLSVLSALVIPCMSLMMTFFGDRLHNISSKAQESGARLAAYLNEVFPSMLVIKVNNGGVIESSRFQKLAHDDLIGRLQKKKMKAFIPQITQIIYVGGLLVLCGSALAILGNSFEMSEFFSFMTSLALLIEPIQGVGKAYNELKQAQPAVERLFNLARFNSKVIENPEAVDLDNVSGHIKFSGVTFKYSDDLPLILSGLSLHIKAGERVAFIGPSGGGKTTLVKLLLRLYDPTCGSILVDNHDIRFIRLSSLRDHIILISQDTMLFSGTVAENIAYRDTSGKINMERIEEAARIANADEFIKRLPQGYETDIGQRGSLLSGGQKQRLAIARALYQKSSILILDEATSALDSRSELLVRQALQCLLANHTVLVIAHRLETVLMADRVLLLDGGKLQEVEKSSLFSDNGNQGSLGLSNLII